MNSTLSFLQNIEWPSIIVGAIVGFLLPLIVRGIVSFFKTNKERFHISLIRGETHTYKSITEGNVTVNVHYKGEEYDGVLSVLEISLVNDGLNDISFVNHFDKPILLRSSSYKIIEAQSISEAKVKADVSLGLDGTVHIAWGLLKKDERVDVRLVGMSGNSIGNSQNKEHSFFNSLSFNVRSDCVDYIAPRRASFKRLVVMSFIAISLFAVVHYLSLNKRDVQAQVYTFRYEDNSFSGYLAFDKEADTYLISPPDSVERKTRLLDFERYPQITIPLIGNQVTYIILLYTAVWILMVLICAVIVLTEKKQMKTMLFEENDED